ncbi:phosphate ABC transporter permease PstA [Nocardioides insulae]|uniref:phosphate ABC transporter permease PstA n=1 Tax=Nocardioides insulae TaxID=394734 RepID=UPI000491B8DC|nr:phosphate ABC transporter permease PstA [Nocardioides insulae]
MSTQQKTAGALQHARLPGWAPGVVLTGSAAFGGLVWLLSGNVAFGVAGLILAFLIAMPLWATLVEGRRAGVDRAVTAMVWSAFGVILIPLVWLIWLTVSKGIEAINMEFLTYSMRSVVGDEQGGLYHALLGTLIVTGIAALISVPIGIFAAIYLIEYGRGTKLSKAITFLVDVMTGIPSIVAGLFAFALFALVFGPGRFGLAGGIALSLLMVPTVVRATEEMLKLVPDDLREASYALGVSKWRTIAKVVLPTSIGGIVTGVVLAIARVIGETAPLLVASGFTNNVNTNPVDGPMMTLPVFIYTQYTQATEKGALYAWGGALTLIVIVMLLNLVARIIGKIYAPKTGH